MARRGGVRRRTPAPQPGPGCWKRLDSRYTPGARNGSWLKVKHTRRQELVIGGWLPGEGRRTERIGALLMGVREGGALRYAGRGGTGFSEGKLGGLGAPEAPLDALAPRLAPLRREASPFAAGPQLPREAQYVEPELVAEVEFTEWTAERVMRAPSFKGLRENKPAAAVVLEAATPEALFDDLERAPDGSLAVSTGGRRLRLTHWDKVLYPATGFTKGDLIAYYARIAPALLPHLADRLLTLKRYPDGVDAQHFYEKNAPAHRPAWVQTARMG